MINSLITYVCRQQDGPARQAYWLCLLLLLLMLLVDVKWWARSDTCFAATQRFCNKFINFKCFPDVMSIPLSLLNFSFPFDFFIAAAASLPLSSLLGFAFYEYVVKSHECIWMKRAYPYQPFKRKSSKQSNYTNTFLVLSSDEGLKSSACQTKKKKILNLFNAIFLTV